MTIPIIALAACLSFFGFLYSFQEKLLYFPDKNLIASPRDLNLNFENIFFQTKDKKTLHAWFIKNDKAKFTILFCHGNAGNISHRLESIDLFHQLHLNVFIFDYRGYGKSNGTPSEEGSYEDVFSAWNYLTKEKQINENQIIIFGRSLGGAIASFLASKVKSKAVVLESTFSSFHSIAKDHYPWLPVRQLARLKYETINHVKNIKSPILIAHSKDDEIIPFRHGQNIFEQANEPKEFLTLRGNHNGGFLLSKKDYMKSLAKFIDSQNAKEK